jgi:hypothetical protein
VAYKYDSQKRILECGIVPTWADLCYGLGMCKPVSFHYIPTKKILVTMFEVTQAALPRFISYGMLYCSVG